MKKSFILLLFSVVLSSFAMAQTAVLTEINCTSMRVALSGACSNAYVGWGYRSNGTWYYQYFQNYTYKLTLVKIVGGSDEVVPGGNWIATNVYDFTNLEQGATYKVLAEPFLCTSEPVQNANGSSGYRGVWGSQFESNTVTVGPSSLPDNRWSFQGGASFYTGNQTNPPFFYGRNEIVTIDAALSKNYDRFFLAISEILPDGVTQGRWRALGNGGFGGWQFEQINTRNLTQIWDGGTGWVFNPYYTYRVQVAISKNNCSSWTEVIKSFRICTGDPSYGCRIGGEPDEKFSISPNPTSNRFQLNGVDFSTDKNYKVVISDISGKEIQVLNNVITNEFNTDNLASGVYIVNLVADNRRLFSSKLVVNK